MPAVMVFNNYGSSWPNMRKFLIGKKFEIFVINELWEGEKYLEKVKPSILIISSLSYKVPDQNRREAVYKPTKEALEFIAFVRSNMPSVKIIMTAIDSNEERITRELGLDGFFCTYPSSAIEERMEEAFREINSE